MPGTPIEDGRWHFQWPAHRRFPLMVSARKGPGWRVPGHEVGCYLGSGLSCDGRAPEAPSFVGRARSVFAPQGFGRVDCWVFGGPRRQILLEPIGVGVLQGWAPAGIGMAFMGTLAK